MLPDIVCPAQPEAQITLYFSHGVCADWHRPSLPMGLGGTSAANGFPRFGASLFFLVEQLMTERIP